MHIYFRALKYVRPYKTNLLKIFLLTITVFLVTLIPPFFTKIFIDNILGYKNVHLLNLLLLGAMGIFIFGLLLDFLQDYMSSVMISQINFDVSTDFFRHLQKLSLKFHVFKRSGDLLYRLFNDTGTINAWISANLITIFVDIISLVIIWGIMFHMNRTLSIISFGVIAFHILSVILFRKPIIKYSKMLREKEGSIYGNSSEYIIGIKEIKACAMEKEISNEFEKEIKEITNLGIRSRLINKFSGAVVGFVNNSWSLLILWYGGKEVIMGYISLGTLMAFLMLAGRIYAPISGLTGLTLSFQDALVGMKRAYYVFDAEPETEKIEKTTTLPPIKGHIQFNDVSFGYEKGQTVFKKITFDIQPGESVALVGKSGVGKSTLCNLIPRFYEPDSGVILIDGYDIQKVSLHSLRNQMAFVSQEPILFSGTIKRNILYGKPSATDEELQNAVKAANIYDFIRSLPKNWDTNIGERGVKLSGGQRQMFALARAFLRNPTILILDEALSFVDLETEILIQNALKQLMAGRTTLTIAHRLSTIRNADKIFVLGEGKIIEQGNHQELINANGLYQQMYEKMARI